MGDFDWHRDPDRTPLFDVMVAMEVRDSNRGPAHRLDPLAQPRRAKEGGLLVVFERPAEQLRIGVTYDAALFTATRGRGLAEGLCRVLAAMAEERTVAEILDRSRPVATA
jgi:hypothetical protein